MVEAPFNNRQNNNKQKMNKGKMLTKNNKPSWNEALFSVAKNFNSPFKNGELYVHTVHEKRLHFACYKNSDLNPFINLFTLTGLSPSSPFFLVCFFLTCFLSLLVKKIIR